MQTQKKTGAGRMGRRGKVLLIGSLALNLAFVGLFAGAYLRHDGGADRSLRSSTFGTPYMMALPRQDRRALLRELRDLPEGRFPSRKLRRELYRDVVASLRAEPFDPAHLQALVAQQAETSVMVQRQAQQAWLAVVADMTEADRASYADALENVLSRGPKRR